MSKRDRLAALLQSTGGLRLLDLARGPNRLTVLAYHRICTPDSPEFTGYASNVSATPAMFARQMDYVKEHFTVIDLDALRAFVVDGVALPPRPLLITFDDGYLDNYTQAYPILRARGLPAVFFLVSRWMGSAYRPWWDTCAELFRHTGCSRASLPLIGERDLSTPSARRDAREDLMACLKTLPEQDRQRQMEALIEVLGVTLPEPEGPQFISALQARELVAHGIDCQMHTASHPILSRVNPHVALAELSECQAALEAGIGCPMTALAYPNGHFDDYNATIMGHLRRLGIPLAFTLEPGPLRLARVAARALEIPRIFLIYKDSFDMFVTKMMGLPALLDGLRFHG